ncbi:hypothetical protein GUITHDRAFT_153966 [Guillardia theta CCMP2712]|uniref:JmjC domain-containing protein n=1 Tax=Guillardia theta (strain CCMP2712) TaxID=905079 RepID=L1IYI9_GUITC|nr:hypothetical protein GUITHDRAFT_153966 [Guillardia theta CCMP2712]EKX40969.1 hypothetical protein GUITHDRAFT_153966 [Guillardia theta CCMP2712]|eukprot:XP_005827949.1 hypothetical protein GUITHDRAFT_153966 [Guillardia theta CCMP2712]
MPVVLTGAMDGWPAWKVGSRKWSLQWFRQTYGNVVCPIDIGGKKTTMTLDEYISKFQEYENLPAGSSTPYLRTWYFSDDIPELVEDFSPPDHFHANDMFENLSPDLRPPFRWLFFGPKGTESKLHVDIWETDAWLGMLEGEKLFTLYHPAHRKYIEREENEWVDLLKPPNSHKFPDQSKAVPAQTILKAGEIIYIPRKWPHHALALSESISLTLNFAPLCVRKSILKHVVPYTRNRARCQMVLGRRLKASDNLMQLCIHGGTIKYGDMCSDDAAVARNPMQAADDPAASASPDEDGDAAPVT